MRAKTWEKQERTRRGGEAPWVEDMASAQVLRDAIWREDQWDARATKNRRRRDRGRRDRATEHLAGHNRSWGLFWVSQEDSGRFQRAVRWYDQISVLETWLAAGQGTSYRENLRVKRGRLLRKLWWVTCWITLLPTRASPLQDTFLSEKARVPYSKVCPKLGYPSSIKDHNLMG